MDRTTDELIHNAEIGTCTVWPMEICDMTLGTQSRTL